MPEFEHPLLSQGRYRLLALTPQRHDGNAAITGYAIASLGGDRLHVAPTLSQARAWLQEQLRLDALMQPLPVRRRR
ncbi:MAG: hypothetical protein ACJ8GK_01350 [Luteimonas sp.]